MPRAVICEKNQEIQKALSEYLKPLGFECLNPSSYEECLGMINLEEVSLIILGEQFSDIIEVLLSFPMYRRRDIIVILLSSSLSTMDRLLAFAKGVDFIVNIKDLNNFLAIFKRIYAEHQRMYKQFKEALSLLY